MAMEHELGTPSNAVHSVVGSDQSPYKRMNIHCNLAAIAALVRPS